MVRQQGTTIARLAQEIPEGLVGTAFDVVAGGLGELGTLLAAYHDVGHRMATEHNTALMEQLGRLHHRLDTSGGWEVQRQVETVLSHLSLDPDAPFESFSGGRKRQVLLARALVSRPDLLLLDEPTNHMDVDAIAWLEEFLLTQPITLLFVTHDRAFLRRVATRIVELDRGRMVDWACDYDTFLERKQAVLDAESKQWANFDKKLAQEEVWIRQGIQARRTRNEGRVRALEAMRRERSARRQRTGTVRLRMQDAERSGKIVIEAEHVSFAYPGKPVIRDFSTTIMRGDKVGIIGPNGSGKTTLLRLLLGQLKPDEGEVELGARLEVAYFDQLREQLDEDRTVQDNIADGADHVTINGNRRHVLGYLQDFLFSAERARTPVRVLSGGERNRLLLARLFTRSFNLLVMDEPTNDLDAETLELLESLLVESTGTLLLVSHDRAFLDEVVTSTLVMEGEGRVGEYVGGYEDWRRQTAAREPGPRSRCAPSPSSRKRRRHHAGSSATRSSVSSISCPGASRRSRLSRSHCRFRWRIPRSIAARRPPWWGRARGWKRWAGKSRPCSSGGRRWRSTPAGERDARAGPGIWYGSPHYQERYGWSLRAPHGASAAAGTGAWPGARDRSAHPSPR